MLNAAPFFEADKLTGREILDGDFVAIPLAPPATNIRALGQLLRGNSRDRYRLRMSHQMKRQIENMHANINRRPSSCTEIFLSMNPIRVGRYRRRMK